MKTTSEMVEIAVRLVRAARDEHGVDAIVILSEPGNPELGVGAEMSPHEVAEALRIVTRSVEKSKGFIEGKLKTARAARRSTVVLREVLGKPPAKN